MSVRQDDSALRLTLDSINPQLHSMRIRLPVPRQETIFGLADGFKSSGLGKTVTKLLRPHTPGSRQGKAAFRDSGLKRGQHYNAVLTRILPPRFAGSRGFFLALESATPLRIDLRRSRTLILDVSDIPAALTLGRAGSQLEACARLNGNVTEKSPIPRWSGEGIWLNLHGGETTVAKNLSTVLDAKVAVSAIILKDWAGMKTGEKSRRFAWSWSTDTRRYATLESDIARFRQAEIRVLGYATPYLDEDSPDFPAARKNGWLVGSSSASPYLINTGCGRAGFFDLWNAEAYAALKSMIGTRILGIGMSGWFADHGFFVPPKNSMTHGKPAIQACREYADLWSALNAEALRPRSRPGRDAYPVRKVARRLLGP